MNFKLHTTFYCFLLCFGGVIKAQFYNLPSEYQFSLLTEKQLAKIDSSVHCGIKPYIHFFNPKYAQPADSHLVERFIRNDPGMDVLFYKHLIRIEPKKEKFKLRLDPLLNLEVGRNLSGNTKLKPYTNTRGFIGSGYVGEKVYFESLFAENQSVFPDYVSNYAKASSIIPGQGRWKSFKTYGYDYAFSSGFVSVQVNKSFNVQAGHGKQKIGNGYRSLMMSDNAFNFPYLRFTQQWFSGRLQYSNIYAVFTNLVPSAIKQANSTERLWQKKAASFQYLSTNIGKRFNFGLFQGLIWTAGDERNRQHFSWHYFNPVIFTNLPIYKLNNKNNILVGADLKVKISNKLNLYAQIMADDLSNTDSLGNAWGYQAGLNYFDALGVKNLFLQAEFNFISESSYQNVDGSGTNQSYTHYNQALAHPLGKGQELILMLDYKIKRWVLNLKYNYQDVPVNGKTSYLNNTLNARFGYVINPAYNLNISLGYTYRNQNFYNFKTLNNETSYFFIGLRTSLYNFYYDF